MKYSILIIALLMITFISGYKMETTAFKRSSSKGYTLSYRLKLGEPIPPRIETDKSLTFKNQYK
jgi:hypothetical protein